MRYVLALDQGTTSSRALLFDETGSIRHTAQEEFPQHFPQPGWVEHEPADLLRTQLGTACRALERADGAVVAVGLTNQRETAVAWDRATGEPLTRAIVWQDRRTADRCRALKEAGHEDAVREKTGLLLDPYFSATKWAWMLDHVDGLRARAEAGAVCFGTVDSWIAWHLTGGEHVTDRTNASRTLLYNLHTGTWDADLLDLFGVPQAALPRIAGSAERVGTTTDAALGAALPLSGLAGDQQAALFGQRCVTPGLAKCTYGTGCFILLQTGSTPTASAHRLLTTAAAGPEGAAAYALEGSVFVGGAVVQWLRDGLGIIERSAEVEALAASVPDADGVVFVPAFTGLGAPHWDPHARGLVAGLTRGTTAAHLARAALDGIAFQVADVLDAMHADAEASLKQGGLQELRVDGGAADNDLLMQRQADLLGLPVVRPAVTETTALGAATLAGLAEGLWSPADLDAQWQEDRTFEPALEPGAAAEQRAGWSRAVERARGWAD